MRLITENTYKEYQDLKRWAKREKVFESAKSITRLEDDIDLPIKKCVMMFALLGCRPVFSCCGFDYDGQPFHKSHQYGEPYISFKKSEYVLEILKRLCQMVSGWQIKELGGSWICLRLMVPMNPHWRDSGCIHFSEECVIALKGLEDALYQIKEQFRDQVILKDTNSSNRSILKFWQYPPKSDWVIRKEDVET